MLTAESVRLKLNEYIDSQIDLDAFEEWLVRESWDIHKDGPQDAQDLIAAIELRLSEFSSDHLNENELRTELEAYKEPWVRPSGVVVFSIAAPARMTTEGSLSFGDVTMPLQHFQTTDKRLEEVFE